MKSKPNILVFFTDDHGQWASHCYGNREIHSPTMDYIAETGARMDRAFTPCPVCSPARASFFTGKMPSAHGVHDHIAENAAGSGHPGIGAQKTIARHLQGSGYYTGLVGKWHLNHFWSKPDGFDQWFTLAQGTNAQFREQRYFEDDKEVVKYGNQAIHLTDRALEFLQTRDEDKPYFLFVGYTNTHRPHVGEPERLVAHYRKSSFSDIPSETHLPHRGFERRPLPVDEEELREEHAQYYAAVTIIDEQMGRILDELANTGGLDNTLIVYTGDHGHMNGHQGLSSKGNATVPQNFLDDSILVPCLLSWPGQVQPGQVRDESVDHCDLFATLLDAGGCTPEEDEDLRQSPGRSYLPLISGGEHGKWRGAQCCEYGNARMIRTASSKLIRRFRGPNGTFGDEFYDLASDPRERENRINDPACLPQIEELDEKLVCFFNRYETEAHRGTRISELPICNHGQPWSVTEEIMRERFPK